MRLLVETHDVFAEHDTGRHHPERPARLRAALAGLGDAGVDLAHIEAPPVDRRLLEVVHDPEYVASIERFCASGGGALDADTHAVAASWEAALRSAGAGPDAVDRLAAGEADAAFLVVRPPGHHALAGQAMGFCLFNNIAVTAARLVAAGERVAVLDWDVHHGNGSEEMFAEDPNVLYISFHQYPFYPGTGWLSEAGTGPTAGTTVNIPLPAGTAGDVYRMGMSRLVEPILQQFAPTWLLVSAGYDAHVDDPLAELRLLPGDYAHMAAVVHRSVAASRVIYFLEGGYDLDAIRTSVAATIRGGAGLAVEADRQQFVSPPGAVDVLDRVASAAAGTWDVS